MTTQPISIAVYFDFLCPYTYRTMQWIDEVQQQMGDNLVVDWRYFSLEQNNKADTDSRNLWEQAEDYEPMIPGRGPKSRGLLAFWGAEAARQQGAEAFNCFRSRLSYARHCERLDFTNRENIEGVAAQAELDMERFRQDFNDRSLLDVIRHHHEDGVAQYQMFGVPTICFDDHNAVYAKMVRIPPAEDAVPFLLELRQSFTHREWLAEVKRPNPGDLS